jgi:hypothetical protein
MSERAEAGTPNLPRHSWGHEVLERHVLRAHRSGYHVTARASAVDDVPRVLAIAVDARGDTAPKARVELDPGDAGTHNRLLFPPCQAVGRRVAVAVVRVPEVSTNQQPPTGSVQAAYEFELRLRMPCRPAV